MKILVTGRTGQLASALVVAAAARPGVDVTALGRPELDLMDVGSVRSALAQCRPDVVINTAAYTAVDAAEDEPELARAVNTLGAQQVAVACAVHKIALIQISTDYVFDGAKSVAYCEDDSTSPLNVYGRTKRDGELAVARSCERHLILRTGWVYSPWGKNFVRTMLRLATSRDTIGVVDDQRGSPTYAPYLADVCLDLAARAASPSDRLWGVYHAAGAGVATWFDVADEVMRGARSHGLAAAQIRPISTADYPTRAQRPANGALACDRLRTAFGLEFPDWRLGVADCVARVAGDAS